MKKANTNIQTKARRKLMKALMFGGGLAGAGKLIPQHWQRPVVASVMLPAHANGSPVAAEPVCDISVFAVTQLGTPAPVVGGGTISIDSMSDRFAQVVLDGTLTIPVDWITVVPAATTGYVVSINNYPSTLVWCGSMATMNVYKQGTPSYVYCSETATVICTN